MKHERERRGIPLRSIAESTKVGSYVFAGLETNNFSRWPTGSVYRRGFVRDYAALVGLPVEQTLSEFEGLFPEVIDDSAPVPGSRATPAAGPEPGDGLRLALAGRASAIPAWSARRTAGAGLDIASVLVLGSFVAWASGASFALSGLLVAICYYTLGTVITGRALWAWWLTDGARGVAGDAPAEAGAGVRPWRAPDAAVPGTAGAAPPAVREERERVKSALANRGEPAPASPAGKVAAPPTKPEPPPRAGKGQTPPSGGGGQPSRSRRVRWERQEPRGRGRDAARDGKRRGEDGPSTEQQPHQ
ncbi:MAG: helix-turn-helix domain-containing protein [Vicinamibacterales bacterium]